MFGWVFLVFKNLLVCHCKHISRLILVSKCYVLSCSGTFAVNVPKHVQYDDLYI